MPIHEKASLEFNATYNFQKNSMASFKPQLIGIDTSDILLEATFFANPLDNMNLVLGFLQEQRSNCNIDSSRFHSIASYRHEPKSFYAQGDYKFGKLVKLIAGTQWNKSSYGISDWISRYGVVITPFDKWGFKLLRGEAFRAPTALETDLFDPGILRGNSNLEPETITTYDVQVFYHDEKTYAAFTYFQSMIDKLVIYDTSAVPDLSYKNGGTQRFNGIEFEAKYFFTPNWHILGSFMHQSNKAQGSVNPSVVPENIFKLGTAYTWEWGNVSLFYVLFGKAPEIYFPSLPAPFGSTLMVNPEPKAINLVNLNLDLDLYKWTGMKKGQSTFTFRIENLLNEKIYVPTLAYTGTPNSFPYGPGTTFYAGITINF